MSTEKLSELSKPVATVDVQRGRPDGNMFGVAWSSAGHALPDGPHFLYSQEYVSALDGVAQFWIGESAGWKKRAEDAEKRIAELEEEFAFIMGQNDGMEKELRDKDARIEHLEAKLATPVRFKVGTDSVDSDVSDRNQPGMVVAVHVDAGDFVKVKGQVYEVKEACFDDHDVTLWFVCGEVLKCAAGCQIEVVSAPEGDA